MGRFDLNNEEKAPSDANKRVKGFLSGNTVQREAFFGTSEGMKAQQVKFDCREGKEGGQFTEFLQLTTAYLNTKLKGGGDVETWIRNGKVSDPAWPDPVGPNPASTKAMLQAKYRTRSKRVKNLRINLCTAYSLVIGQCTDYLRSRLKGQEKWEATSNERYLLGLLESIKSLSHKHDKDTEYHHVAYHTLLR